VPFSSPFPVFDLLWLGACGLGLGLGDCLGWVGVCQWPCASLVAFFFRTLLVIALVDCALVLELLMKGCCCAVRWGCWGELNVVVRCKMLEWWGCWGELNVVVRCKMLEWWGCWGSCWLDCVVNVLHRGDVGVGWRWGWVVIVQRWAIVVLGLWVC